ncbi:DUF6153 family protein [Nocardioides rubriscoriae]|uniref:DUF6153 family protein n=1 Tax=Nocardioides rubriscoriae TaxID=642762 RepID=UPI0011E0252B|nr:DUF6153 family protein [Nocardioides rubriscoriae]
MTRSSLTPTGRATALPVGRVLVLLAALAGLFAMHGLSGHGAMDHEGAAFAVSRDAHTGGHPAAAMPMTATTTPSTGPSRDTTAAAAVTTTMTTDVMGLCLAVLAGAWMLLVARGAGWPAAVRRARLAARVVAVRARARAPDPPDLLALCVHRC